MLLSDLNENKVTEIPELAKAKLNMPDSSLENVGFRFRQNLQPDLTSEEKQIIDLSNALQQVLHLPLIEQGFTKKVGKYIICAVERWWLKGNPILVIFPQSIASSQNHLPAGWKPAQNFIGWLPPVEVQKEVYDRLQKNNR
jgi:hypothetical protein